jgi:hypothetical protein
MKKVRESRKEGEMELQINKLCGILSQHKRPIIERHFDFCGLAAYLPASTTSAAAATTEDCGIEPQKQSINDVFCK